MQISPVARFVIVGLTAAWLAVGLAWAGLLVQLEQSDGLLRYPGAVRLTAPGFQLDSLPKGHVRQYVIYHTADTWTRVLNWYARYLKLDLDRRARLSGNCFHFTDIDAWMSIRQSIGVTLCSQAGGTRIFISRQFVLLR